MSKRIFKDLQPERCGPHPDYEKNLSIARLFCKNVQKNLLKGMVAKIVDSEGIKEAMLMISFTPPQKAKMGNYAAPIFLHQKSSEASKETERIFNSYMHMAKNFWERHKNEEQSDFF